MSTSDHVTSNLENRISSLIPRLVYKRAVTPEYRDKIFRLRHDAYLREGAISASRDGRFTDDVDDADNTVLFGIQVDGELMSSIRISIGTSDASDIPTAHVFPDLLGRELARGRTIIDPTRFVVDHASSRRHPELPYLTLRVAWIAMAHFNADVLLAAVRPEHAPFYRRFWHTRVVAPARDYPLLSKPICLTLADYAEAREHVHTRYPFLRSTAAERERVFDGGATNKLDVRAAGMNTGACARMA